MNPIHQWLEGKKRVSDSSTYLYDQGQSLAYKETIQALPSLLSAMEAEIGGRIGEKIVPVKIPHGSPYISGVNEERERNLTIITDYFNHIRG